MDISSIQSLYGPSKTNGASAAQLVGGQKTESTGNDFGSVFDAVLNMVDNANTLQNRASAEEIKFALGEADNTHDLAIAQSKANIALQYTVAVRDRFLSAYQEIMQMQI